MRGVAGLVAAVLNHDTTETRLILTEERGAPVARLSRRCWTPTTTSYEGCRRESSGGLFNLYYYSFKPKHYVFP